MACAAGRAQATPSLKCCAPIRGLASPSLTVVNVLLPKTQKNELAAGLGANRGKRRGGRAATGAVAERRGVLSRCTVEKPFREFESLRLRHQPPAQSRIPQALTKVG